VGSSKAVLARTAAERSRKLAAGRSPRPRSAAPSSKADPQKNLVHELQVHQIELQLQNDELQKARLELEESRDRYQDLYDFAPAGYLTVSRRGRILEANLTGAVMLGEPRGRIIDHGFGRYVQKEDLPIWEKFLADGFLHSHKLNCELRLDAPGRKPMAVRLEGARAQAGETSVMRISMTDVTEAKRAELESVNARAAAEKAAGAKGDFLARMSHEIRTPLNGVLGMTQLLTDTPLTAEQREYVETIEQSGTLLLSIINDILDLSKIEAGHYRLLAAPFELRKMLAGVIQLILPALDRKGLSFNEAISPDLPAVIIGDTQSVQQMLLNLLSNAIKFTERGGITLGAGVVERSKDSVRISFSVRDTGIGILPEHQDRIFEVFEQISSGERSSAGGTGLGLPIASKLARMLGGELKVTSASGQGSLFEFSVPFGIDPRESLSSAERTFPGVYSPLRLLVAEDNRVNAVLIQSFLTKAGHTVTMASDGVEVLRLFALNSYDAVLMDIQLPVKDGLQTTAEIRRLEQARRVPRTPILAITAHAFAGARERYMSLGMDGYISKPFRRQDLLDAVEEAHMNRELHT
jgi:signal transduction histidine kinase/ActR/RegA family two-component response regulator